MTLSSPTMSIPYTLFFLAATQSANSMCIIAKRKRSICYTVFACRSHHNGHSKPCSIHSHIFLLSTLKKKSWTLAAHRRTKGGESLALTFLWFHFSLSFFASCINLCVIKISWHVCDCERVRAFLLLQSYKLFSRTLVRTVAQFGSEPALSSGPLFNKLQPKWLNVLRCFFPPFGL